MRGPLIAAVATLAAVAALSPASGASFTGTKSNPSNSFAAAASFCNGSTQTASATKDAYVDSLLATSNFGSGSSVSVQSSLVTGNQRVLVQFSLPSVPAFCSVTAATLQLYASSSASSRTIDAYAASASWTETGVTWNNQPGTSGSAASSSSGSGSRTWDVTTEVQGMYSGTNNGFLLRDSSESSAVPKQQAYQSREGTPDSQDPQLTITFG